MGKIQVPPHQWAEEAEKKNKERNKFPCWNLPPLPVPVRSMQQLTPSPIKIRPASAPPAAAISGMLNKMWRSTRPPTHDVVAADSTAPPTQVISQVDADAVCQEELVHVAITINREYEQGAVALMYSILLNAACPARVVFHICHLKEYSLEVVWSFFPTVRYMSYVIDGESLQGAIRGMKYRGSDLENPLNYVRIVLPHLLPPCISKFIYLDTDTLMLGRIEELFSTDLQGSVIGSPEFCNYKIKNYFTKEFWANRTLSKRFEKNDCYFNPGVLVVNAEAWRTKGSTKVQKNSPVPLYTLGSLPPFLLVFAGSVAKMAAAWNEHDLGCSCGIIPVPSKAKLLHWSCSGKPWRRLRSGSSCSIDTYYWQPYDLMGRLQSKYWCDDGDLPKKVDRLPILHPSSRDEFGITEWADMSKMGEPVLFEQLFNNARRRHCPGPVHIPGMQKADGSPEVRHSQHETLLGH